MSGNIEVHLIVLGASFQPGLVTCDPSVQLTFSDWSIDMALESDLLITSSNIYHCYSAESRGQSMILPIPLHTPLHIIPSHLDYSSLPTCIPGDIYLVRFAASAYLRISRYASKRTYLWSLENSIIEYATC